MEKGSIRQPVESENIVQRVLAADGLESSGAGEESSGLWMASVLLFFRIEVREVNESEEYPFLYYMEVGCPRDTMNETFRCIRLRWSTDEEEDHSLRRDTGISEEAGLYVGR